MSRPRVVRFSNPKRFPPVYRHGLQTINRAVLATLDRRSTRWPMLGMQAALDGARSAYLATLTEK